MRIFENDTSSWSSKVNFVDEHNTFIGYDMEQKCCEDAGWFIVNKIHTCFDEEASYITPCVNDYAIDKYFFISVEEESLNDGGMVCFRLISEGLEDLFLHIYNSHNGYYYHGLQMKYDGVVIKDEKL